MVLDDRSLISTPEPALVVCGPTTSVGPGLPNPNILIMKLNYNGGIVWARPHPSAYAPGLLNDVSLSLVRLHWGVMRLLDTVTVIHCGWVVVMISSSQPLMQRATDRFALIRRCPASGRCPKIVGILPIPSATRGRTH